MKIESLQISNILSFKYYENIEDAEKISFDGGVNILIGGNGSGKSTALEVINFLLKRVIYKQYTINQNLYLKKNSILVDERKQILLPANNQSYSGFRLDPNWENENDHQCIRLKITLDDIDTKNLLVISSNQKLINDISARYTTRVKTELSGNFPFYTIDVSLNRVRSEFTTTLVEGTHDLGFEYLVDYNFYKGALEFYNLENPNSQIEPLRESFSFISGYRNYHSFEESISLKDEHPLQQIQGIRGQGYNKSLNSGDTSEPPIFGLVRLRIADIHFGLMPQKLSEEECEKQANKLPFLIAINKSLKIINLECKIKLTDQRTWQYNFHFFDLKRKKSLADINSLSAGQKGIIHLVFEAFGKDEIKGGLVIIDEPELHLHYQFQHEYLNVIDTLNRKQKCQYILATHSEALINSTTISRVKRFSLDKNGYTRIKAPILSNDQRSLIKILDNTRSTYAFFANKVILVEGDTDRYFFRSLIKLKSPKLDQEVAILDMNGKGPYKEWLGLFSSFGLQVYVIGDFDFIYERFYPKEKKIKLTTHAKVGAFKEKHTDWKSNIESDYRNHIYILKEGDLEHYLGIRKGLRKVIDFCNQKLRGFLKSKTPLSIELIDIVKRIKRH